MTRPRILYIDDEPANLSNFRQFFTLDYEVFTALNADEALQILAQEGEMALIVSDQRLPGISGSQLLAKVREIHPDTPRMMITAYSDPQDMLDSINNGNVFRYILKPWDEIDLQISVKHAVERYAMIKKNQALLARLKQEQIALERLNAELEERVDERTQALAETNQVLTVKCEELEEALRNVKTLQGLLPICSYCKKIRNDSDYWQELEDYMSQHADMTFTHGVCPTCYNTHVERDLAMFKKSREMQSHDPGQQPPSRPRKKTND